MKAKMIKIIAASICFWLTASIALGGCAGSSKSETSATLTAVPKTTASAATSIPSSATATPKEKANPNQLTIWIPPDFDPNGNSPSGNILKNQINLFSSTHPEIKVDVRVKSLTGPGNMLDSLSAANAAARGSLPDLVALNRVDFQSAAIKGYIYPVDGLTTRMETSDWFNYAKQLSTVEGTTFGLPFSGDMLVMVFHDEDLKLNTPNWDGLFKEKPTFLFAGADPIAAYTLANYLSAGGKVGDPEGKPSIDADILKSVLSQYQSARQQNIILNGNGDMSNSTQVWNEFKKTKHSAAITWFSIPFSEAAAGILLAPIPVTGDKPVTLADGYIWAMANPDTDRQQNALQLADSLTEPEFLAQWCMASGCLPPRPSSLTGFTDPAEQRIVSQIEMDAVALPASDLINTLGPVLRDATLQVIRGQVTSEDAAKQAADNFTKP